MSLTDELASLKEQHQPKFREWLDHIATEEEKSQVLGLIADRGVPIEPLTRILRKNGVSVSKVTLKEMRDGLV